MIRSRGHCNTMGTASTMALVAEALGTVVPGRRRHPGAGQPAAGGRRTAPAGWPWRWSPPTAGRATVLTKASFHNAIVALAAIGGSTNAVVHLLAIAGPARRRPDPRRLRPDRRRACRCWSTCSRPAGS